MLSLINNVINYIILIKSHSSKTRHPRKKRDILKICYFIKKFCFYVTSYLFVYYMIIVKFIPFLFKNTITALKSLIRVISIAFTRVLLAQILNKSKRASKCFVCLSSIIHSSGLAL